MDQRTVLVTGPARSGTTITCELLNDLADTVALDEPLQGRLLAGPRRSWMWKRLLRPVGLTPPRPSPRRAAARLERWVAGTRTSLLTDGTAMSKNVDGQVLGAKVSDARTETGLRQRLAVRGEIHVDKELSDDFLLVVKQNAGFTAMLDALVERFPVYAVVRNPLPTLCSWQTVPMPVQEGRAGLAEAIDERLRRSLDALDDRVERQLHLLSWFCEQYHRLLPTDHVVRYEDIVTSSGAALRAIAPSADVLRRPLTNRPLASAYELDMITMVADRLLASDGSYWHFYSRDHVRELLDEARLGRAASS